VTAEPHRAPGGARRDRTGQALAPKHAGRRTTLGAATHPVQDPQRLQPLQRRGDRADAHASLGGNGSVGWIQTPGAVVQEVEDQCVQHGERGVAHGAAVVAGLVRAAVEVARPVPEAHSGLLGHSHEADRRGRGAAPDRPGGIAP
jgi:hypothetical protein